MKCPDLFAYKLNDRVRIAPLEAKGRVVGLYFNEDGAQYRVRYFYEGAARTEYFYADEIEEEAGHARRLADGRGYKEQSVERDAGRNVVTTKWRLWAFARGITDEEQRLRGVIGAAYLRLERLDDSNPEMCHARQLLECAMSGKRASWP